MMENKIPRVGVGVIVINDGKVLLGKRKNSLGEGYWSACGGHLEYGETIEECAARELLEETGLKAQAIRLGTWTNNIIEGKHYVTVFVFVDSFEGVPQLMEPDKCEGWIWFEREEIPTPLFPTVCSLIEKVGINELMNEKNFISTENTEK